jgi:hypothetical protein
MRLSLGVALALSIASGVSGQSAFRRTDELEGRQLKGGHGKGGSKGEKQDAEHLPLHPKYNGTFKVHIRFKSVLAVVDPTALRDVREQWDIMPKPLKVIYVIKVGSTIASVIVALYYLYWAMFTSPNTISKLEVVHSGNTDEDTKKKERGVASCRKAGATEDMSPTEIRIQLPKWLLEVDTHKHTGVFATVQIYHEVTHSHRDHGNVEDDTNFGPIGTLRVKDLEPNEPVVPPSLRDGDPRKRESDGLTRTSRNASIQFTPYLPNFYVKQTEEYVNALQRMSVMGLRGTLNKEGVLIVELPFDKKNLRIKYDEFSTLERERKGVLNDGEENGLREEQKEQRDNLEWPYAFFHQSQHAGAKFKCVLVNDGHGSPFASFGGTSLLCLFSILLMDTSMLLGHLNNLSDDPLQPVSNPYSEANFFKQIIIGGI